jgi:hypothetical protein
MFVPHDRITQWTRRFMSAFGLLVIALSILWMVSAAVGSRNAGTVVPLVYADDPADPTKPKTASSSGPVRNGAAADNDNQELVQQAVNLVARNIVAESDPLIVNEKVDICVLYTVVGEVDIDSFRIGFGVINLPLQDERARVREGEHSECFEVRQQHAGDYLVAAALDVGDEIPETHEEDNRVEALLTWVQPPRPDLMVTSFGYLPRSTDSCDEPLHFYVVVYNGGSALARRFDVELLVNSQREGRERIEDVVPGGIGEARFDELKLRSSEPYELRVRVDTDNDVEEIDEQNNEMVVTRSIACQDIPFEDDDDDDDDDDD